MLVEKPRDYLRYAYEQRFYASFNVCNLEMAKAVIEAATIEKAPVIVQTYPGDWLTPPLATIRWSAAGYY